MMITRKMLEDWRQAKNLAVTSFNIEPDVVIAIQEMYIEAKQLRKDNLKFLNQQGLLEKFAEYVRMSRERHYADPDMDELFEELVHKIDNQKLDLELFNE